MTNGKPKLARDAAWADEAFARKTLPTREIGTHKWDVGGVVVVAGSPALTGAAWLASRTAGRSGAGIVYLASGRSVVSMLAGAMPEVAHVLLSETDAPGAAKRAVERLEPVLEKARAVVIGPGLGDDELTDHLLSALFGFGNTTTGSGARIGFGPAFARDTGNAARESPLFRNPDLRVVLDADALNWLAKQDDWWTHLPAGRSVLTPHPGEMARLTGRETGEITADPQATAREYASTWKQVVLLKGGYSAASDGERVVVAEDAPVSLATAGTGDVLSGMVGAFLAQGIDPLDAAGLALHVGARAAREVEERLGTLGVIATDLPDAIARQLARLAE